jgi:hypothetical protein
MGLSQGVSFAGVNDMKLLASLVFVIVATTLLVFSTSAQTSLSLWPYYVEVKPEKSAAGLYQVVLPLAVMDKARHDLSDLRLYDSTNREIPYAIRIRRDRNQKHELNGRLFNYVTVGPATEVSIDLGENSGEHNELEIKAEGSNFRRPVEVEGSDSGTEWRILNRDTTIFHFDSPSGAVESQRVEYPRSRYRYLRVRVIRDQVTDREAPWVSAVKVLTAVRELGTRTTWSVPVPSYQLLRNEGADASAWTIDLGGRAPCDRLRLQISDNSFSRPYQVEAIDDPENVRLVAVGNLNRFAGSDPLVIVFHQEEIVRKLRLQITDHSNPTLNITSIEASAPARQFVFELKEPNAQPLRLFFGNAKVPAPHYDFEKQLPVRISTEPMQSTLGNMTPNPEFKPEPLPLTERIPWLIYVVLAVSSLALAFILFTLARTVMRKGTSSTGLQD